MKVHSNPSTGGLPPGQQDDKPGVGNAKKDFDSILTEQQEQSQNQQSDYSKTLAAQTEEANEYAQKQQAYQQAEAARLANEDAVKRYNQQLEQSKQANQYQVNQDLPSQEQTNEANENQVSQNQDQSTNTLEADRYRKKSQDLPLGGAQQFVTGEKKTGGLMAGITSALQNQFALKGKGMKDPTIPNVESGGATEVSGGAGQSAISNDAKGDTGEFGELLKSDQPAGQLEGLEHKKPGKTKEGQTLDNEGKPQGLGQSLPLSAYFPHDAKVTEVKQTAPAGELQIPHIEKIVDRILTGINASGNPEVKVDMQLPDLGKLNVNITRADVGLMIQVNAENEKAGLQLSQNMQALYVALSEKALNISNIQIMIQNQPIPLSELIDQFRPNSDQRVHRKDSSSKASEKKKEKQDQPPPQKGIKGV